MPYPVSAVRNKGSQSDTTAPTVTITSNATSPTTTNPITQTITFSEPVTGFAVGDITISAGGSLASFTAVSTSVYTVSWTLAAGANTMDINAGVCTDLAGNPNQAATQFAMTSYTLYVLDTMTDADNVLLVNHVPDVHPVGVGWGATFAIFGTPPDIKIISNQATYDAGVSVTIGGSVIDAGVADLTIEADVTTPSVGTGNSGIYFRYQDTTHYWLFQVIAGTTNTIKLTKVNGSGSDIQTASVTIAANSTNHLKVVLAGNSITCTLGATTLSTTDSFNSTKTKHGISISRDNFSTPATKIDNVWMATIANPT